MSRSADRSGKQGEFINQLRDSARAPKISARRWTWVEPFVRRPKVDEAVPKTRLGDAQRPEPAPKQAPTADLPKTLAGNIDVAEVKQDLTSQLRAQRGRKKG